MCLTMAPHLQEPGIVLILKPWIFLILKAIAYNGSVVMGIHLLKDANLFAARIKPVVGLPGEHSMAFHKSFLTANSAVAGTISYGSIGK